MQKILEILDYGIQQEATDIHLEMNQEVFYRIGEDILRSDMSLIATKVVFEELLNICHISKPLANCGKDSIDEGFTYEDIRVRAHIFKANRNVCATLRLLYSKDVNIETDSHKELLKKICRMRDGLVLITGPTGSGKSFTLSCCIAYINAHMAKHIITLEDPVEFVFTNHLSLIHQKQLGIDVGSMAVGIKDALREDPDIIVIGELRDKETLEAALHAAETGHLVFATLHTQRAIMAINRMLSLFPAEQQEEVRNQLSQVLRAVICQRLTMIDKNFVIVRDILLNTPAVANLIRQRKEPQISSIQETQMPMQTMEMAVRELIEKWGNRNELTGLLEDCNA